MTEPRPTKDSDTNAQPGNSVALVLALFAMGWMTLMGIGMALQGLWVIGVPMALIFGIWFLYTLIKRPAWKFGANNARPGRRSRFWETRP